MNSPVLLASRISAARRLSYVVALVTVLVPSQLLTTGCRGKGGGGGEIASAAEADDDALALVPAGRHVEIEAARRDRDNIRPNDPDCFVWPKTCPTNSLSFFDSASEKEPVEALKLDPGVYDVTLTYGDFGQDNAARWTGKLTGITVDSKAGVHHVVVTSPDGKESLNIAVRLQATPEAQADGSICDDYHGDRGSCGSDEPHYYQCSAAGLIEYGCDKAHLYDRLQLKLCEAKQAMQRSEFAGAFACSEIAAGDMPSAFD